MNNAACDIWLAISCRYHGWSLLLFNPCGAFIIEAELSCFPSPPPLSKATPSFRPFFMQIVAGMTFIAEVYTTCKTAAAAAAEPLILTETHTNTRTCGKEKQNVHHKCKQRRYLCAQEGRRRPDKQLPLTQTPCNWLFFPGVVVRGDARWIWNLSPPLPLRACVTPHSEP